MSNSGPFPLTKPIETESYSYGDTASPLLKQNSQNGHLESSGKPSTTEVLMRGQCISSLKWLLDSWAYYVFTTLIAFRI